MFQYKNWAVVGDVLNEGKFACSIAKKLERKNYNVFKVNPRSDDPQVYKSLKDIKDKVDVVDLVITPTVGIDVVKEACDLGIDKIFIQPGAGSNEIRNYCKNKGVRVYEGCVLVEL